MRATQFSSGISCAVTTVNSCQGRPPVNWMFRIRPRATGLRTVTPYSIPGNVRSSTYLASPVTLSRASLRRTGLPTVWNIIYLLYNLAEHTQAADPSVGLNVQTNMCDRASRLQVALKYAHRICFELGGTQNFLPCNSPGHQIFAHPLRVL